MYKFILPYPPYPLLVTLSPLLDRRAASRRHPLLDPDHLICNGAGGAFLHPTHLFVGASFGSAPDAASEATAALYSSVHYECSCRCG